ncbi:hypothetical protein [Actinomadura sp. GTD37]|uniref:hypothetical protein n=1 Tax=Actinomadura sp. GTD37 TaxID=1778030 RepID=UPI0035C09D2D
MMTSRAVDLAVFVVCAGVTGVWGLLQHDRLYEFLLFLGLAFLVRHQVRRPTQETDESVQRIKRITALFYAQGLQHGARRPHLEGDDQQPVRDG